MNGNFLFKLYCRANDFQIAGLVGKGQPLHYHVSSLIGAGVQERLGAVWVFCRAKLTLRF